MIKSHYLPGQPSVGGKESKLVPSLKVTMISKDQMRRIVKDVTKSVFDISFSVTSASSTYDPTEYTIEFTNLHIASLMAIVKILHKYDHVPVF